jgi:WD40 repeat protein
MNPSSLKKKYTFQGTLKGHTGAILCLRATDDGNILVSGGTDGVKLWSLATMAAIRNPGSVGLRGATTALVWMRREDEPDEVLYHGTQNGYLVCWKQSQRRNFVSARPALIQHQASFEEMHVVQLAIPGEITGIAFDAASNRLAVCNRNSVIQMFTIDGLMTPRIIFSVTIMDFLPKTIAFGHMNGDTRGVVTFGMHDGQM